MAAPIFDEPEEEAPEEPVVVTPEDCPNHDLVELPLPLPPPTTQGPLTSFFAGLGEDATLATVRDLLSAALVRAAFRPTPPRFLQIPCGFAMMTEVERIRRDGKLHANRWSWSTQPAPVDDWFAIFKKESALSALAAAIGDLATGPDDQRYRVMIFLVSPFEIPVSHDEMALDPAEITGIFETGDDILPESILNEPFTNAAFSYRIRAFVYEFVKEPGQDVVFLSAEDQRRVAFDAHLEESGLKQALQQP